MGGITEARARDDEDALVDFARALRDRVVRAHRADGARRLAAPADAAAGDLQYEIDRVSEEGLVDLARDRLARLLPFRILSEGLDPKGVVVRAPGDSGGAPASLVVVDPIDGTRGLMHDKRSAFVLAGVAPDRPGATLADVGVAVMAEIPTTRSELSDVFSATRGSGVRGFTERLDVPARTPLEPSPSRAATLAHGFASFSRFFPGAQDRIGAVAEDFFARAAGSDPDAGHVFEDQYVCNAGQCHAVLTGRDRLVVDLRPLFLDRRGRRLPCAHPYDVLGAVILEEAGVPVTDAEGRRLDCPLDLTTDVAFAIYAGDALRARLEPHLLAAVRAAQRRA